MYLISMNKRIHLNFIRNLTTKDTYWILLILFFLTMKGGRHEIKHVKLLQSSKKRVLIDTTKEY